MNLVNSAIANSVPVIPRPVVKRISSRYIAGDTLDEAVETVRDLNREGCLATVDLLGESTESEADAAEKLRDYKKVVDALDEHDLEGGISIKLTGLGLTLDEELCRANVEEIVAYAADRGRFVRVDMVDSPHTDANLRIVHDLYGNHQNTGAVLQAYMRRSLEDVQNIVRAGFSVRLCKGIYDEPRSIAYKDFDTVRQNYIFLLDGLLKGGIYVGIATHDEYLIWHALRLIHQLEIPKDRYEFQMLLGVDEELRGILVDAGHKLRVYVPFGEDWYEYSTRPLKENPKIYPGFAVGEDVHLTMRMPLYQRLLSAGVTFVPNSNVSALDGSEVKVRNIYTGEEHGVEQVDTLVTWLGSRAHDDFWHALKGQVGELYAAGDCLAPRSVEAAMTEGAEIARSL